MWATLFSRPGYLGNLSLCRLPYLVGPVIWVTLAYVGLALFSRPSYSGDLSLYGQPYLVGPLNWVTLAYGYPI